MKNYNWEYFKSQINKKLSEPETKNIYSQRKIDVEPVFGFMKAILGFTRMSVRGLNKVKRELGFVLMALNIRKVVAQRAENNQKFIKRQFLYYFNRNCLFHLSKNFMSRTPEKVSPLSKKMHLYVLEYILVSQPNIQHEEMLFNVIRHKQFSTYKMEL